MAKSFVDGMNVHASTISELLDILRIFGTEIPPDYRPETTRITDTKGNPIERVRLFKERLTDGSFVYDIEIQFQID